MSGKNSANSTGKESNKGTTTKSPPPITTPPTLRRYGATLLQSLPAILSELYHHSIICRAGCALNCFYSRVQQEAAGHEVQYFPSAIRIAHCSPHDSDRPRPLSRQRF